MLFIPPSSISTATAVSTYGSFLLLARLLPTPLASTAPLLVAVGAWIFAFFLAPETKGKSLEEIEAQWRPAKHPSAS